MHLPRVGVGLEDLEAFSTRDDDLLKLCTGKVAVDRMRDARGTLEGQAVEMHGSMSAEVTCLTAGGLSSVSRRVVSLIFRDLQIKFVIFRLLNFPTRTVCFADVGMDIVTV